MCSLIWAFLIMLVGLFLCNVEDFNWNNLSLFFSHFWHKIYSQNSKKTSCLKIRYFATITSAKINKQNNNNNKNNITNKKEPKTKNKNKKNHSEKDKFKRYESSDLASNLSHLVVTRSSSIRPKKVVLFPEVGRVKTFLSITRPHRRMSIRIYIFDLKTKKIQNKQTKKKQQKNKKKTDRQKAKESVENIMGYDDIVCEFAQCTILCLIVRRVRRTEGGVG